MTTPYAESATEFAVRSADALAATLNLRRTVARLVHLAVPRFGTWAAVALSDGAVLRRMSFSAEGPVREENCFLRSVDADAARLLHAAMHGELHDTPDSADVVRAFGATGQALDDVRFSPDLVFTVVPLTMQSDTEAALVVAGTDRPEPGEFAALAVRGAAAISAAFIYEERAALASTLRAALLPAPLPRIPGIDLGASYRPAQETMQIGGDFYDVMPRSDDTWAVSLGDVCGKGVDAAVLTGQVRQSLRTAGLVSDDPVRTLRLVNDAMLASGGDSFVTIVYGLMARVGDRVRVRLAVGGHPPPLVLRNNGEVEQIGVRGTIVGMLERVEFTATDVLLSPGDLLLLFTDGLTEARGACGMLGVEPVLQLLADCSDLSAQAVTERLMQLVLEHLNGRRHDDIALLAVRCEA